MKKFFAKKNIIIIACVLVVALLGTGAGYYFLQGDTEEKLADNQRYVYAYIQNIQGNEISYREMDEIPEMSDVSEGEKSDMSEMSEMGEMPSMPEGGEMPDMSEKGERSDMGERPDISEHPDRGEMQTQMKAKTVTTLIPVGIKVHTTTDTVTTFGRLVSGDMIKILMETNDAGEEVITEIWMQ